VVVAGIPTGDASVITASIARRKGLDLRFSRRMNRVYPQTIALVQAGRIDVHAVVSARAALADAEAAFAQAGRRDGNKVVIVASG
jgi:L-iditol 2-dehydrogenase